MLIICVNASKKNSFKYLLIENHEHWQKQIVSLKIHQWPKILQKIFTTNLPTNMNSQINRLTNDKEHSES